jgi:calreticulin
MNLNLAIFFGLVAFCASHVYFQDDFSNADWQSRWVVSDWKRDSGEAGDWGLSAGKYHTDESKERGLKTLQDARFYDISAAHEEFSNKGKTLVIQFSVKHEQNIDCGGGYVKLVGANNLSDQKNFQGGASETVYNVMFGPDICGYTKKVHFILHKGGKNHLIKDDISAESDEFTHFIPQFLTQIIPLEFLLMVVKRKVDLFLITGIFFLLRKSTILMNLNQLTGLMNV